MNKTNTPILERKRKESSTIKCAAKNIMVAVTGTFY
jgi:hypothetical protein